jgi:hypothetical protein
LGLIESTILSICMSASGQANLACTNAVQAGAKQSGFEQMTNSYESHQVRILEEGTYSYMGRENAEIAGGTLWLANAAVTRKASLALPNFGLCDKLSTEVNRDSARLVLRWFW